MPADLTLRSLVCAAAVLLVSGGEPVREWPVGEEAVKLTAGEVHRYRIHLSKDQFLRLVVDQRGIDAVVSLKHPVGFLVLRADRQIGDNGPELVLAVAGRFGGNYSLEVRGADGSGSYAARVEALRPASAVDRRSAEAYRRFTGAKDLEPEEAMVRWTQARATWRELGEVALEAEAIVTIARHHFDRREFQPAAELYREAAAAFARAGDHRWEATSRNELGSSLLPQGATQEAADQHALALSLARRIGDRVAQAAALHGLGQALQNQGEPQRALDRYREALTLWQKGEPMRSNTLHQLGVLYARYLHDEHRGGEHLRQALDAWGPGQEGDKAGTLSQLGRLAYEQGQLDAARRYYEKALELRGDSDRCRSAVLLARLALVEEEQGVRAEADARRDEALRIVTTTHCPKSEPTVHLLGADLAEKRGDPAAAMEGYRRAEALFAELGDRMLLAESLAGTARSLGDRQKAREVSRRALDIIEGVRPTVLSDDLRTSFFSGARQAFDFHIALLLDLRATEEAWVTAEESRARVLQDLLTEAGAGLRDGAPELVARERSLQRQLNALESQRLKMSEAKPERLQSLRREIDARIEALEMLRGELRRRNPHYSSLARPEPVSLATVRRDLLDDDTVLLEYRLGEAASTVWAVTRDALTAVRLPPRGEIEPVALEATHLLQSLDWPGRNPQPLCELSQMILAPVAPFLGHRRMVVVADGALEALPFAALPFPADAAACPEAPVLVDTHETVSLPSVATLLTQRRLLAGRSPAAGWLAVVADPAYCSAHRRLPGSAQEAVDIAALFARRSPGKIFRATGAAASRQTVTSGALRGFRILHFATHGTFDDQPLLSALHLADIDTAGRPVDEAALRAHEIYGLDLPAELVVLSACETALGRDVPGEGLVSGLPRAFLYAGAARVLVSLWEVEDQSTRDLMVLFYRGLLDRNLPPAQALQDAQRTLRQKGRRPGQWAGFVLLGDWRPLPPFSTPR